MTLNKISDEHEIGEFKLDLETVKGVGVFSDFIDF